MIPSEPVQGELFCDCGEPAFPGDDRCARHSGEHEAAEAYAQIKRELAEDAVRAQDAPPFDGGAT
jgi:hypothetical protein